MAVKLKQKFLLGGHSSQTSELTSQTSKPTSQTSEPTSQTSENKACREASSRLEKEVIERSVDDQSVSEGEDEDYNLYSKDGDNSKKLEDVFSSKMQGLCRSDSTSSQ